jgi:hypothetical protein
LCSSGETRGIETPRGEGAQRFLGRSGGSCASPSRCAEPGLAEEQSSERIQAAIVLLARGDPVKFDYAAELAEADWRDVLVFSGLGNEDWPARLEDELEAPS